MKNKKKKLKHEVEGFFKSDKFLTLDPKDFMSEEKIDFEKQNLNIFQEAIEYEISEIGRAHVRTPVTRGSRMPSSA